MSSRRFRESRRGEDQYDTQPEEWVHHELASASDRYITSVDRTAFDTIDDPCGATGGGGGEGGGYYTSSTPSTHTTSLYRTPYHVQDDGGTDGRATTPRGGTAPDFHRQALLRQRMGFSPSGEVFCHGAPSHSNHSSPYQQRHHQYSNMMMTTGSPSSVLEEDNVSHFTQGHYTHATMLSSPASSSVRETTLEDPMFSTATPTSMSTPRTGMTTPKKRRPSGQQSPFLSRSPLQTPPSHQYGGKSGTCGGGGGTRQVSPCNTTARLQTPVRGGEYLHEQDGKSPYTGATPQTKPKTFGSAAAPSLLRQRTPVSSKHHLHKRREGISPCRILDGIGISTNPRNSVLAWGNTSSLVAALGCSVYVWTPASIRVLLEGRCEVTVVSASTDTEEEGYCAVGLANGQVYAFSCSANGDTKLLPHCSASQSRITALDIHHHHLYCGNEDGTFIMMDLMNSSEVFRTSLESEICRIEVTEDGNHIAVGTAGGISLFHRSLDAPTIFVDGATFPRFPSMMRAFSWLRNQAIGTLVFATGPRNSLLCVRSLGGNVVSTLETGHPILFITCAATEPPQIIVSHGISSDDDYSFGLMMDGTSGTTNLIGVYEWDERRGCLRYTTKLDGHLSPVFHMALSPDSTTMVTGSGGTEDSTLRFWEIAPTSSNTPHSPSPFASPAKTLSRVMDDEFR